MMMRKAAILYLLLLLCVAHGTTVAQEMVGPVDHNPLLNGRASSGKLYKSTALTLPLFEDFTGYSPYPDSTMWADNQVYVNNTMGRSPISRGVATFDALGSNGKPHDTIQNSIVRFCDSFTLKPLDLSALQPSDSVYLSFFYQPAGNGFAPEIQDSLILFFKKSNGTWVKTWSKDGTSVQDFRQAMVPLTDTSYFYAGFQFRFVNKASMGTNDDTWNIDYIRMDANRNLFDTAVNDVAFTTDPGYMLNDYTYMPYRHFLANTGLEIATQMKDSIRNGYGSAQNVTHGLVARESMSNTPLYSSAASTVNIGTYSSDAIFEAVYPNTTPIGDIYDRVIFENKFYLQSPVGDRKENDTVIRQQIFDNYLAYDDGTAEKSYYLNMFPSLPGKIAIEHHLNEPDVVQGLAIYFGRQVPVGTNKYFSIAVYRKLLGVNGSQSDELLTQQDFMYPQYLEVNNYYTYKLDNPVSLPAGAFYVATIQPALSGSDSLYFGLDVNREQGNHAYYNVDGTWVESTVAGAIMMRPIVGAIVFNTGIKENENPVITTGVSIYPNPAGDHIVCDNKTNAATQYYVSDIQGRSLKTGLLADDKRIDISELIPGMYLIRLSTNGVVSAPQKIIKQ
jgi:hypothetical protein